MKKTIAVLILLAVFLLTGCVSTKTTAAQAVLEEPVKRPSGGAADYSAFSVIVEEGWETMDIIGGVQIFKTTGEMLQIQMDGDGVAQGEDIPLLESINENYNGSGIRETQLLGNSFHTITYQTSGVSQCMYTAVLGGKLVKIQATGASYDALPAIKTMVESIIFKID